MDSEGDLLRFAIKRKGLTQEDAAKMLGISRVALGRYFTLQKLPEQLKNRLTKIGLSYDNIGLQKANTQVSHSNATLVDMGTMQIMWVPLVDERAKAGYLSGFSDKEYMEALSKIPFTVDKEYKGEYVAFTVRGDSVFEAENVDPKERKNNGPKNWKDEAAPILFGLHVRGVSLDYSQ